MNNSLIIFSLLLLSEASLMNAWGNHGHMMVCKIAQQYLTNKTVNSVLNLLPATAQGKLANVCSWADKVRSRYPWSRPLHYINIPGVCNYDYSRDCHDANGVKGRCVTGAINNFTMELRSNPSNTYNLTESLMFLAHFVGDVHQPLHVGFANDEGGNTIIVYWYERKSNLHQVWDTDFIKTAMKKFYNNNPDAMVQAIQASITNAQVDSWRKCRDKVNCANDYAVESIDLACNYAYKGVRQNANLTDNYFNSRIPIVQKRLAQGGVWLASILNSIFDQNIKGSYEDEKEL